MNIRSLRRTIKKNRKSETVAGENIKQTPVSVTSVTNVPNDAQLGAPVTPDTQITLNQPDPAADQNSASAFISIYYQKKDLPKFPLAAIPLPYGEFIKSVADNIQVSPDLVVCFFWGAISTCAQGKYIVSTQSGWTVPTNLYLLCTGKPSERKSSVRDILVKPIEEYQKEINERLKNDVTESELRLKILDVQISKKTEEAAKEPNDEDKKKELRELLAEKAETEVKNYRTIMADDITLESIPVLMAKNHERLSIVSAEGGFIGTLAGRYGKDANLDVFLKAWDGESVNVNRITRDSIQLYNPNLTICLALQPLLLEQMMSNEIFAGRGLLGRFLYALPDSMIGKREYRVTPIPAEQKQAYDDLIRRLLDIQNDNGEVITLTLSEEAEILNEKIHYEMEKQLVDQLGSMTDWAGKIHGQVLRISGLLTIISQAVTTAAEISAGTLDEAWTIGKYYIEHAKEAYGWSGASDDMVTKDAKYILSKIKLMYKDGKLQKNEVGNYEVSHRELMRSLRRFKHADEAEQPMRLLEDHGYLHVAGSTSPSAPKTVYISEEAIRELEILT